MATPVARIGDSCQGICHHGSDDCPHPWTGTIVGGASKSLAENAPIARIGDKVQTNCPHCATGTITGGSSTVLAEGSPCARIGDSIVTPAGKGTIVGSAQTVLVA